MIPSPCKGWNNPGVATSAPFLARQQSLMQQSLLQMQRLASVTILCEDRPAEVALLWHRVSFPADGNSSTCISPNAVQIILWLLFTKWFVLYFGEDAY